MDKQVSIDKQLFLQLKNWLTNTHNISEHRIDYHSPVPIDLSENLNELQQIFFPETASIPLEELLNDEELNKMLPVGNSNMYELVVNLPTLALLCFYIQSLQKILPRIYRHHKVMGLRKFFEHNFESNEPKGKLNGNGHPKEAISKGGGVQTSNYKELARRCSDFDELLAGQLPTIEDYKIIFSSHTILLNALEYLALEEKNEAFDKNFTYIRDALLKTTAKMTQIFSKLG